MEAETAIVWKETLVIPNEEEGHAYFNSFQIKIDLVRIFIGIRKNANFWLFASKGFDFHENFRCFEQIFMKLWKIFLKFYKRFEK